MTACVDWDEYGVIKKDATCRHFYEILDKEKSNKEMDFYTCYCSHPTGKGVEFWELGFGPCGKEAIFFEKRG